MRGFSASQILDLWERGDGQGRDNRALALLACVCPETPPADLAHLSVGERDALLMEARQAAFGPVLNSYAECPNCGEGLEFPLDPGEAGFRVEGRGGAGRAIREFAWGEAVYRFRLPDTTDLEAAEQCGSVAEARSLLLERCILEVRSGGAVLGRGDWPEEAIDQLGHYAEECDPLAEITLNLTCPACRRGWRANFDIASFFWQEIDAVAKRLLREVAGLARAFGWREADILAMSGTRRRYYLDLVS